MSRELHYEKLEQPQANPALTRTAVGGVIVLLFLLAISYVLPRISQVFTLPLAIVFVLVLIVFIGKVVQGVTTQKTAPLRAFAESNGFTFTVPQDEIEDNIALFRVGDFSKIPEFKISGEIDGRPFAIQVITLQMKNYYRPVPIYYGLIEVGLEKAYGHVVVDTLDRDWDKSGAELMQGDIVGQKYYQITAPFPSLDALNSLCAQLLQIEKVSVEIAGNRLYMVKNDGLDFSSAGMQRVFELIEKVNILDK